jgi:hypothetical protein
VLRVAPGDPSGVSRFLLHHTHTAEECEAAFAAWRGFASPLRDATTIGSCLYRGHEIWWELEAATAAQALAHLPPFVAERTAAIRVSQVRVP